MMMWIRACVGLMIVGLAVMVPELASSRSSGAPAGFAGDIIPVPNAEPRTCTTCHSGNAVNDALGGGSVTINAPESAAPGETVTITVAVTNAVAESSQGFSATVKTPDGVFVGDFTIPDPATVRLADGNDAYVTHTFTSNGQTSWTFEWTAPSTDVPSEVVIYTAGNAADGNGSTTGDYIYTATHTISLASVAIQEGPEAEIGVEWAPVSPNPVRGTAQAELTLAEPMHVETRLVDGRGRVVRQLESGSRSAGASSVRVDVRGLAPGLYFLVADTEGGRRTQTLNVVR